MAKLLVVDDEVGIRELLSEILEDEGHDVLTAEDAGQARKLIEENPLDLILLDIWMPVYGWRHAAARTFLPASDPLPGHHDVRTRND